MPLAGKAIEKVSEAGVEIDLHKNRDRQKDDYERLGDNLGALKPE